MPSTLNKNKSVTKKKGVGSAVMKTDKAGKLKTRRRRLPGCSKCQPPGCAPAQTTPASTSKGPPKVTAKGPAKGTPAGTAKPGLGLSCVVTHVSKANRDMLDNSDFESAIEMLKDKKKAKPRKVKVVKTLSKK